MHGIVLALRRARPIGVVDLSSIEVSDERQRRENGC